jgi:protein SCO1/2
MSHTPLTLMRAAPGQPWLRIEGFVTPTELLKLYRQQLDRAAQSSVATR